MQKISAKPFRALTSFVKSHHNDIYHHQYHHYNYHQRHHRHLKITTSAVKIVATKDRIG